MSEIMKLLSYFIIGGTVVTLTSYFGAKGSGLFAAFITSFPCISLLGFYFIHKNGGNEAIMKYIQGFLIVTPAWILYILITYFLYQRIGLVYSLVISVTCYVVATFGLSAIRDIFLK